MGTQRNFVLGRPLVFGDHEQLEIINDFKKRSSGEKPIQGICWNWEDAGLYGFNFSCIKNTCRAEIKGRISWDELDKGENIVCAKCCTEYTIDCDDIYVVPDSLNPPRFTA